MKTAMNVFLVDDDNLFIFLTKKTIKSTEPDVSIVEFNDGELALEYIKENAGDASLLPDIIFLDISMPIMDGWAFLKEYVSIEPKIEKKIHIYLFTSSISPHDVERAKEITIVTDFIIKPIQKEKLIDIISHIKH